VAGIIARLFRPVTVAPAAVDSPATEQYAPTRWRPEWTRESLVFQGGFPKLKRSSMTGGGFIPAKTFAGKEALMWQPYATPVSSVTAGGQLPSRPAFLTALLDGTATGNGV
jgi:hypothetical protein